jgi:UDP-N-acetylglucosamine:LPS N-acetylglucosamine transferase
MRILHVLSANFFAGSVAYAVALAEAHRKQGHQVWLASDAASLPTAATLVQLPISQRKYRQRWHNIQALRQLIKAHAIDVVHAHSRAASWVSYFAVRGLPVPLVSTVHGRQHLHTSTSLFDVYGDKVVAICGNLAEHLRTEVKMAPAKLAVIPNGIAFSPLGTPSPALESEVPRLAFIGRFNGRKGEQAAALLEHIFPPLLREHAALRVALIGGELDHLPTAGKAALGALQAEFGARVEVVGFTDDVPDWLEKTDLIIGAGRVAIEALGAGRAVLALGEA